MDAALRNSRIDGGADDGFDRHAVRSANIDGNAPLEQMSPRGTMIGLPAAPLAQLAEQLTLNQCATPPNAEENGTSLLSAARGAAVGAESARRSGDELGRGAVQRAALVAGDDDDLAELLDRWAALPDVIRRAVMALVRTAE
jgi:hypothetical protein